METIDLTTIARLDVCADVGARCRRRALSVEDLAARWSMPADAVRRIPRDELPYLELADARHFLPGHVEAYERRRSRSGDATTERARLAVIVRTLDGRCVLLVLLLLVASGLFQMALHWLLQD